MADEANHVLRQYVTGVQQRPEWGQDGQERQMVTAYFRTPNGFTGSVKMSLTEWRDEETRNNKLFQAIADLEGPFWESPQEEMKEGK